MDEAKKDGEAFVVFVVDDDEDGADGDDDGGGGDEEDALGWMIEGIRDSMVAEMARKRSFLCFKASKALSRDLHCSR